MLDNRKKAILSELENGNQNPEQLAESTGIALRWVQIELGVLLSWKQVRRLYPDPIFELVRSEMEIPEVDKQYRTKKTFHTQPVTGSSPLLVHRGAHIHIDGPFSEGEEETKGMIATLLDPPNEGVPIFLAPGDFDKLKM